LGAAARQTLAVAKAMAAKVKKRAYDATFMR